MKVVYLVAEDGEYPVGREMPQRRDRADFPWIYPKQQSLTRLFRQEKRH
jgi:hypothetical protein